VRACELARTQHGGTVRAAAPQLRKLSSSHSPSGHRHQSPYSLQRAARQTALGWAIVRTMVCGRTAADAAERRHAWRTCPCQPPWRRQHAHLLSEMQPSPQVMMGLSSTVLHTVPASPPQYVDPEFMMLSAMNCPAATLPNWPMFVSFLLAPNGPVQRVTALRAAADRWRQRRRRGDAASQAAASGPPAGVAVQQPLLDGTRPLRWLLSAQHTRSLTPHAPDLLAVEVGLQVRVGRAVCCERGLQRPRLPRHTEACNSATQRRTHMRMRPSTTATASAAS
jgi:hypothetical protein